MSTYKQIKELVEVTVPQDGDKFVLQKASNDVVHYITRENMLTGYMEKSEYDTDNDGIVEQADSITGQGALATLNTVTDTEINSAKLNGIEAGADVTDATNVNNAGATMNSDTTVAGNGWVLDEDNMASNSATKVPTQQSVKAYVDNNIGSGFMANVQTFLSSGTWTKPATGTLAIIECWGAGGGGNNGSGGGGGAYIKNTLPLSSLPATVTVTVAGVTAKATDGSSTTFGSYVVAYGGRAGQGFSRGGGGAGAMSAGSGSNGGAPAGGATDTSGQAGHSSFGGGGGSNNTSSSRAGDSAYGGGGGGSGDAGANGYGGKSVYGGGGGGGWNDPVSGAGNFGQGGTGGAGMCRVTVI